MFAMGGVLGATLLVAVVMWLRGPQLGLALTVLLAVAVTAFVKPTAALGATLVLALLGDSRSMPWWPSVKNFSAHESVLFFSDQLTISPFEIVLGIVLVVWLIRQYVVPGAKQVELGTLWGPVVLLGLAVVYGLVRGLAAGGDRRVALFDARPLLYVPIVYLLATNLFSSFRHYGRVVWGWMAALFVEASFALWRMAEIRSRIGDLMSPVEHTAAVHMNLLIVFIVGTLWFGTRRAGKRILLVALAGPVVFLYVTAERRAAVVALVIGVLFLAIVLYGRDRARFLRVMPLLLLVGAAYTAAFWNTESGMGFPAQAIKTVIAPSTVSAADASSDLYRQVETFDLWYTIRQDPIFGRGFGQPFDTPMRLPDISFFEFWAYLPHNSILGMWMKVGALGFVAFLSMFGLGVAKAVVAARRMVDPDRATLVAVVGSFIPMTLVVAYVDITFDVQTTTVLGTALALVASAERIAGHDRDVAPEEASA